MKKLAFYTLYVFILIWSTSCDKSKYDTEERDINKTETAAETNNESGYGSETDPADSAEVNNNY